jgi:hypothetical protein
VQAPPTQTLFVVVAHAVASGLNDVSVQTGAPLPQAMDDVAAHGFVEVQAVPAVHAVQLLAGAPLHTPVGTVEVVQAVPAGWPVASVQTGAPLAQLMVAVAVQTFDEVQAAPWVHATQVEEVPLQTPGARVVVVQAVPAGLRVPSTQAGGTDEQLIVPAAAQGPLEVQALPGAHELQVLGGLPPGPVHTLPVPAHTVLTGTPEEGSSTQTGAPVEQLMVAFDRQGLLGVQAAPAEHGTQLPELPLHTPATLVVGSVQGVPFATNVWSVQTGPPEEHTMAALVAHGSVVVQVAPAVHATQLLDDPLQTPAAPVLVVQAVPAVLNVWSVQTGAPELHTMAAVTPQAVVEVQLAPAVHALQVPVESQTPVPPAAGVHAVPGAAVWVTVQTGTPEPQL